MNKREKDPCSAPPQPFHPHMNGRRCCGRPLSEKCSPEEEKANTNTVTGEKSCCKHPHAENH
jgi:hypothetical protein